jgi:hypothetical protein
MDAIYVIAFVLFDITILTVVAFAIVKSKKKRSQSLLENARAVFPQAQVELSPDSQGLFSVCRVILRNADCNINIAEYPGAKNSPPATILSISTNYPLNFNIRHETGLERFGKKLNLFTEFQIGELYLDRQLYIKVDDQNQARNYFMQSEVLNALKKLVQIPNFSSLACEPSAKSGNFSNLNSKQIGIQLRKIFTQQSQTDLESCIQILHDLNKVS